MVLILYVQGVSWISTHETFRLPFSTKRIFSIDRMVFIFRYFIFNTRPMVRLSVLEAWTSQDQSYIHSPGLV